MQINNLKNKVSISLLIILIGFTQLLLLPQTIAPPTWGFTITPSSRSVPPGGTTQFTVYITGTSTKPIQLIYSPPEIGVTVTFSTSSGNPPYATTMTVQVAPSKPTGSYTLFISAVPQGDLYPGPTTQNRQVTLNINVPVFDFTLTLSPPINEVEQGETAQYTIILTYSHPSFSGTVINYQVTGLGPGMNWIPMAGGVIGISTSQATPPGSYPITIIGSALGITHQTTATLIVTEAYEEPTPTETATETITETFTQTPTETPTETISEEEQRQLEEEQRQREEEQRQREEEERRQLEEEESRQREEELRRQEEEREQQLLTYAIIGILAVVITLLAIVLLRRRSPPPQRPQAPTQYCANCGEPLTPGKTFCGSCGEKIEK